MTSPKIGDKFPEGVGFSYVPYTEENSEITSCGLISNYDASKEWADKKVVLFAVPGAFTPGCSVRHLPGYLENKEKIFAKGVDIIAVLASNDAWVMDAWSKANRVKGNEILFLSDTKTEFSDKYGWASDGRTSRYAIIIDHGKIVYAEKEPGKDVTVSGAEAVLAKL